MSKQRWSEVFASAQGNGTANTAGTAASLLPGSALKTLPANYFDTVGQAILLRASGRISSVITTPGTARFDVRLGGTVVFDGLAILLDTVAAHADVAWELEIALTLRAVGKTANFWGIGKWSSEDILGVPATAPKGVLTAMLPWNTVPVIGANFDATVAQELDLFFTQTAASGSCQLHQYWAESKN